MCASLWFESQREWEKETTVFVICPKLRDKVKVGVSCVSGCFQGLVWVTSLMVQSGALREPSLAFGDLTSAVGEGVSAERTALCKCTAAHEELLKRLQRAF